MAFHAYAVGTCRDAESNNGAEARGEVAGKVRGALAMAHGAANGKQATTKRNDGFYDGFMMVL